MVAFPLLLRDQINCSPVLYFVVYAFDFYYFIIMCPQQNNRSQAESASWWCHVWPSLVLFGGNWRCLGIKSSMYYWITLPFAKDFDIKNVSFMHLFTRLCALYCKMIKDAEKGLISPHVMTLIKMSTSKKKIQKDRASSPPISRIPSCRLYFTWRKAIRSSRVTSRTCTSTLQCK